MPSESILNVALFGPNASKLRPYIEGYNSLRIVEDNPDAIVCYGGDGTLLSAELKWPGVTKVPIRNSRRGIRMLDHPADEVIQRLAENKLVMTEFIKLECVLHTEGKDITLQAMNEVNLQLGRTSSAVRFKLWIDGEPFENGVEIIGDGFLVSTPFGSTAYYRQITRGIFYTGLGIAFKFTSELINHVVVRESSVIRVQITRGPAVLAHDNAREVYELRDGDEMTIQKAPQLARVLAWEPLKRPSEEF